MDKNSKNVKESKEWDKYWINDKKNILADTFRKYFLARPMARMVKKHFRTSGVFVEAGSGSSMDSHYFEKKKRKMIAVDVSKEALKIAIKQKNIDETRQADIRRMPFRDKSIDGIWNLGVMEHFSKKDIDKILTEFKRILKDDGTIILLWPAKYNIINLFFFWMFPDMPNTLRSRRQGREFLAKNGFDTIDTRINLVGDIILVGRKSRKRQ